MMAPFSGSNECRHFKAIRRQRHNHSGSEHGHIEYVSSGLHQPANAGRSPGRVFESVGMVLLDPDERVGAAFALARFSSERPTAIEYLEWAAKSDRWLNQFAGILIVRKTCWRS